MKILICLLISFYSCAVSAQSGAIAGKVLDNEGEPLIGAVIQLTQGGTKKAATTTDEDGTYILKPLDPGRYDLTAFYIGFKSYKVTNIIVSPDRNTEMNIKMQLSASTTLREHVIIAYKVPLIDKYNPGASTTRTAEEIEKMPLRSTERVAATSPGVLSHTDESISIHGARSEGTTYIGSGVREIRGGRLTSGEVNDFSKWELWKDEDMLSIKPFADIWQLYPERRFTIVAKTKNKKPLVNAKVSLIEARSKIILWQTLTDNTGKAELWQDIYSKNAAHANLVATVEYGGDRITVKNVKSFAQGINIVETPFSCNTPYKVDIAFIVDATGSMQDEINYLKDELHDIITRTKDSLPGMDIRTGTVFYRDHGDEYLTKFSSFTNDINETLAYIRGNNAGGGGDGPEAVDDALETAIEELDWRDDVNSRIAFLILDAPPHAHSDNIKRIKSIVQKYAEKGIRIVPVACSGVDKSTEYLLRSFSLATNGTYVFLTNHSGIGNPHMEPTTDKFDVKYMNQLLYNIICQFTSMPSCSDDRVPEPKEELVSQQIPTADTLIKEKGTNRIDWKIYPNPTQGIIYVEHTNTSGDLFISDISGKVMIKAQANPSGKTEINVGSFPSGTYFIRYCYGPEKWMTGKFSLIH